MKYKLTKIEGHSESHTVSYSYRGVTITGISNASSSSPYTRSRTWTITGRVGRASTLADAKARIDFSLDNPTV